MEGVFTPLLVEPTNTGANKEFVRMLILIVMELTKRQVGAFLVRKDTRLIPVESVAMLKIIS